MLWVYDTSKSVEWDVILTKYVKSFIGPFKLCTRNSTVTRI